MQSAEALRHGNVAEVDHAETELPVGAHCHSRSLLNDADWEAVCHELHLSRRELELVQRIFDGRKLAAIAQDMHLALGTVKTYSQRIRNKLQVTDQRELILSVMRVHLASSSDRLTR